METLDWTLPDFSALPAPDTLRHHCKALAMADAILCRQWEYRYFSHNAGWAPGEEMASMRDGQGSEYFILFSAAGVAGKLFDLEAVRASNQPQGQAPDELRAHFADFVAEPAFSISHCTAFFWRRAQDAQWSGAPETGPFAFLKFLTGDVALFRNWAQAYYECAVDAQALAQIFAGAPLDAALTRALNPDVALEEMAGDAAEIGWPVRS